jgi:hypothetical protein
MSKGYLVYGMKRSGHHAIIQWIAANSTGATRHTNDCYMSNGKLVPGKLQSDNSKVTIYGKGKVQSHIWNIEDFDTNMWKKADPREAKNVVKSCSTIIEVLVLRDPFNWVASCLRSGGGPKNRLPFKIPVYKRQARFCKAPHREVVFVNFNLWFDSEGYRKDLSEKLRLASYNEGLNKTSPRGGGSSFDKMAYKNRAQEMDVLNRYKEFADIPSYRKMMDEELTLIAKTFFGMEL